MYAGMKIKDGLVLKYTDKDLHDCEQDTIEQCAQVAENICYENAPNNGAIIAAAIRALKDSK